MILVVTLLCLRATDCTNPISRLRMRTTHRGEIWLRTNEIDEFIAALEHAAELARDLAGDVMRWKWLIITLHNALQGACTCALRGADTTGTSMLTKPSADKVWHWLNVESRKPNSGPLPREVLAPMSELFERTKDESYLRSPHRLVTNPEIDRDVEKLNKLRNTFIHFVPRQLSLEVSGMPRIVGNCCDVIEHLADRFPTFDHHLDATRRDKIKAALRYLRSSMSEPATAS